ncbi:MAG: polyprenol phosphomannose-dependent alpha 1,6 mannosyltransferase MptB [Acidimicrobiales bacterium]
MADTPKSSAPPIRPATIAGRLPARARTAWTRGRELAHRSGDAAVAWSDRIQFWLELAKVRLLPSSLLAGRMRPDDDDPDDWRFLRRPALLGFLALVAVVVGASLTSSPFKLEMSGTWFFGEPASGGATQSFMLFGLVAVYGGLVLLMRVWYGLMKALARRPGVPMSHLGWILCLWMVPMLVVAPIFSRDVFSYAAQGEMVSRHINPYNYGPGTLGAGPYVNPVDPLWMNTPAPYGPLFLMIDGFLASASLHHQLVTVVLLRLFALAGVALIAWCIPKLARSYGRDAGPIYVLAVLNPLVVLTLVGAAHNDSVMVGLLLAGLTAARYKHPVWGVVLCTLAAAIKAPAALGIVYVAWSWTGTGLPWRQRVRPLVSAGVISLAIMAAFSLVSGLGWGWVANLETPGTVRSWLAPATGIGMLLSGLAHAIGLGVSSASVLSVTRVLGLTGAAGSSVYLLWHSDRVGSMRAIGLSLLLFVVLGPVVQPWYLTWGVILLAIVATGRLRSLLIALSVVSPFIGLPGGRTLLDQLIHSNPLAVAASLLVLLGVLLTPIGRWATAWRDPLDVEGPDELTGGGQAEPALGV